MIGDAEEAPCPPSLHPTAGEGSFSQLSSIFQASLTSLKKNIDSHSTLSHHGFNEGGSESESIHLDVVEKPEALTEIQEAATST